MVQPLWAGAMLLAAFWLAPAGPVRAQEGSLFVELNKLEQKEAACRATIVLRNTAALAFRSLKFDLVIFGSDEVVSKRLALQAAPLPAGKTSVKIFDIADQPCKGIGSILVNDVLECTGQSGQRSDCLARIEVRSRASAGLIK